MGEVRITDGVTSRTIQVPELAGGVVELRLAGDDAPVVVVPEDVTVQRASK